MVTGLDEFGGPTDRRIAQAREQEGAAVDPAGEGPAVHLQSDLEPGGADHLLAEILQPEVELEEGLRRTVDWFREKG